MFKPFKSLSTPKLDIKGRWRAYADATGTFLENTSDKTLLPITNAYIDQSELFYYARDLANKLNRE